MPRRPALPLWIGLFEVAPLPGRDPLEGAGGAFVSAVAPAEGAEHLRAAAERALEKMELAVLDAEQVEPFDAAEREDAAVREAAREAARTRGVAFATFHTYPRPRRASSRSRSAAPTRRRGRAR